MSLAWSSVKALSIPVSGTARDVKAVSIGGVEVWRKLPYDAEVEYIESTGTQWIDTGYSYSSDSGFACDAMLVSVPADTFATMFGAIQSYNGVFVALNNTVPIQARFGASSVGNIISDITVQSAVGIRHKYELSALRLAIDNSVYTRSSFMPYAVDRTVWVCSCNDSISGNLKRRPCSLRVFSFTIKESGAIVRDFVPVRVGSGANAVGYLYDRANPTGGPLGNGLYGNSGSGAFVVGPDRNA